jgi:hypothetical protein
LAGATVVALLVGAAGGYFGEAAASPNPVASRLAPSGSKAGDTAASGTARGAAPKGPAPSSAMMCPDHSTTSSAPDIGSASRLFIRTTSDGVTVRAYRLTPTVFSCVGPPVTVPPGTVPPGTVPPQAVPPNTVPGVVLPGGTGSSPGSAGSGGSAGSSELSPIIAPASEVTVELSDDNAVGQGVLSGSVCVGPPVQGGVGATGVAPADPTTTTTKTTPGASTTGPQDITTGPFGVLEGDPVWWVAVEVASDVTAVKMTFPDGSTDQMAPVDGIAVVAGRITPAVASADPGPYTVRGTLTLLGAGGAVLDTITLPEQSAPIPVPGPEPLPAPANGTAGSSSSTMIVCPQGATATPKTQSSATTEKR